MDRKINSMVTGESEHMHDILWSLTLLKSMFRTNWASTVLIIACIRGTNSH
jgi:hypothetical protein